MNLKYYFDVKMKFLPLDFEYFNKIDDRIRNVIFKSTVLVYDELCPDLIQSLLMGLDEIELSIGEIYETRRLF